MAVRSQLQVTREDMMEARMMQVIGEEERVTRENARVTSDGVTSEDERVTSDGVISEDEGKDDGR